jgi:hypothetical protein
MGTDLYALRKPNVQLGKRTYTEMTRESIYIDSFQILKEWRDSDIETWPECLRNFWFTIYDYESAQTCIKNIKKYYPEDQDLLDFACWLEKMDKDIIYKVSF